MATVESAREPFLSEHRHLSAGLEQTRRSAAALPSLTPEERRRRVERVLRFVRGRLERHADAKELALYPVVARRLRHPAATAPMVYDRELVHQRAAALEAADAEDVETLQELLYGLHALLEAHFRKEERFYLPLLKSNEAGGVFERMEAIEFAHDEGDVRTVEPAPHGFPRNGGDGEKLAWAVRYAVLAPSSHNSQPWRFHVDGDVLELHADRSRALGVVDPLHRELAISCGAALLHLRAALRKAGEKPVVELLPDEGADDLLARVRLGAPAPATRSEELLFWAIRTRHTTRRRFDDRPVPAEVLEDLVRAAEQEGARLTVLEGDDRARFAELVAEADRRQFGDPQFREELAGWLRSNRSPARDGMPGCALGMSEVASVLAPVAMRTFDLGRTRAGRDRGLAFRSPVLSVVTTTLDEPRDWLRAGQAVSRLLLRATVADVVASFLNQPIEVPELRPQIAALTRGGCPQIALRLGFAPPGPPTPRRPLDQVLDPS